MWSQTAITNAGLEVLARAAAGSTLILDGAASGSGTVSSADLAACTDLDNRKQTLTIVKAQSEGTTVKVEIMFRNAEIGYQARQIGLYGHTGNGSPVLMAIYQDETGISIPGSEMPDFAMIFAAVLEIGASSAVAVTTDTSALVSQSQLDDAKGELFDALSVKEVTVVLESDHWENLQQTVPVNGMTTRRFFVAAPSDDESWDAAEKAKIYPPRRGAGTLTFRCKKTPVADINVTIGLF